MTSNFSNGCKKCSGCFQVKRLEDFSINKYRKSGRRSRCKDCCKKEYQEKKEAVRQEKRDYYLKNKEKIIIKNHKYAQDRLRTDSLYKLTANIRTLINNSVRKRGYTKASSISSILGCSYEELLEYLGPKPTADAHIDHICPCSEAKTEEELLRLQHYTNLMWLPAEENLKKGKAITERGRELCNELLGRDISDAEPPK